MKNFVRKTGITLISLIIIIILLLVLAGVTINILSNSGIFERAKEAKEKWSDATEKEENLLNQYSNEIDVLVSRETITIDKTIYDKLASNLSITGNVLKDRPDTWTVGIEYEWKDGNQSIFGQRFTGNFTNGNSTENLAQIIDSSMSTAIIKSWGGDIYDKQHNYHLSADGGIFYNQNGYYANCYGTFTIYPNDGSNPYLQYYHHWNSNNADYDIWVLYTK